MMACDECGSNRNYTTPSGEVFCRDCGLLLNDFQCIQDNFIPEGNHAAHPESLNLGGMSHDGRIVKGTWMFSTKEKDILVMQKEIELISGRLELTEHITSEAKRIIQRIMKQNFTKGRDNLSFAYASVYAACQINDAPRTPLEITAYTDVSIKKMIQAYKVIQKDLNLKTYMANPTDFIPRFGTRIGLSPKTISYAIELCIELNGNPILAGKKPSTIAATALYVSAKKRGETITQREVSNNTGVLEVTIRKRSKEIIKLIKES